MLLSILMGDVSRFTTSIIIVSLKAVQISYQRWLKCSNENASKKIVARGILVFDFELFIGERCRLVIDYLKSKGVMRSMPVAFNKQCGIIPKYMFFFHCMI